jgi:hypothetical protein
VEALGALDVRGMSGAGDDGQAGGGDPGGDLFGA